MSNIDDKFGNVKDESDLTRWVRESDERNGLTPKATTNPDYKEMCLNDYHRTLVDDLHEAEEHYRLTKQVLEKHQALLYLTTDFKAEGCTNDPTRKAFITNESLEEIHDHEQAKTLYHNLLRIYELIKQGG